MPGSKKSSKSDWERVKKDAAADSPIAYDPETDLYDPNDPAQVAAFFSGAKVVRKPGRPKAETTKVPVAIRLSPDVVEYFKSTVLDGSRASMQLFMNGCQATPSSELDFR